MSLPTVDVLKLLFSLVFFLFFFQTYPLEAGSFTIEKESKHNIIRKQESKSGTKSMKALRRQEKDRDQKTRLLLNLKFLVY